MSNDNGIIGESKGIDGIVKHCANCGVEFSEALQSHTWITCQNCDACLMVKPSKD